jgi:hypothetical protein
VSPFEQRLKYDEIIIYAGQGSKIYFYLSSVMIPALTAKISLIRGGGIYDRLW